MEDFSSTNEERSDFSSLILFTEANGSECLRAGRGRLYGLKEELKEERRGKEFTHSERAAAPKEGSGRDKQRQEEARRGKGRRERKRRRGK